MAAEPQPAPIVPIRAQALQAVAPAPDRAVAPWRDGLAASVLQCHSLYEAAAQAFTRGRLAAGLRTVRVGHGLYVKDVQALVAAIGGEPVLREDDDVVLDLPDGVVRVAMDLAGQARVAVTAAPERAEAIAKIVKAHALPHPVEPRLLVLAMNMGGAYLTALPHRPAPLIESNYTDGVVADLRHVLLDLASPTPCGRVVLLRGEPGTGKCVSAGTLVVTSAGIRPIEELDQHPGGTRPNLATPLHGIAVPTVRGTQAATRFYNGGEADVLRVRTARGFEIEVTPEHPLLTPTNHGPEWARADSLRAGDYVGLCAGSPPGVDPPVAAGLPDDLAYLIGALIGDGCLTRTNRSSPPMVTKSDRAWLERLCDIARRHIDTDPCIRAYPGKPPFMVLRGGARVWSALVALGVPTCAARHKYVPASVLRSSTSARAAFIRALFDCDAHVDMRGAIEWTTASERLGREVQVLLMAHGVWSSRNPKRVPGYDHTYWRMCISGQDVERFHAGVGLTYRDKARRLDRFRSAARRNTNVDVVPRASALIREVFASAGPTSRADWAVWGSAASPKRAPSRARVQALVAARPVTPESTALARLADNNVRWDRVVDVGTAGVRSVFDLTVPGAAAHSFVANGFYAHNSYSIEGLLASAAAKGDATFVVVPPTLVSKIGDPGLLDVFLGEARERGTRRALVLLLEDADEAIRKRSRDNLAALSTLLNMSDGLVGRALDLRVLATTNADQVDVDPALLRPGRLCKSIHVGPLPSEQARRVAARLGRVLPERKSYTLADIYGAPMNDDQMQALIKKARAVADDAVDRALLQAKKWSRAFINDLPDAAFAVILPGGFKDGSGKTTPRDLRLLPHHGAGVKSGDEHGSVDLPHLRNALARLDQIDAPAAAKERARRHLMAHAKHMLPEHEEK